MIKFTTNNSRVTKFIQYIKILLVLPAQGKFTAAQKKELFQLVARNNTVRTDVISKLGILERQEAAWKDPDYNYVWEGKEERERKTQHWHKPRAKRMRKRKRKRKSINMFLASLMCRDPR